MFEIAIRIGANFGKIYIRGTLLTFLGSLAYDLVCGDPKCYETMERCRTNINATAFVSLLWFLVLPLHGMFQGEYILLCLWFLLIVVP
jgi:hypothetical protein